MEKTEELNFLTALWPFIGIVFLIVLGVLLLNQQFNKKLYRQKLEKEKLKAQHQFDLLQSSIAVQEEERKRIARDLHDELGAALSMARMHLLQLEQQNTGNENDLAARLQNIRNMLENALASTRRISHELMPPLLESFGLQQTLEAMASEINKLDKLRMEVIVSENFVRLPMHIELGLYRVCMELVNNTIRHAQAGKINIQLLQKQDRFLLAYSDNGIGLTASNTKKGIGERSIETRIHALNGTLTIQNAAAGGMEVKAEIPMPV